jgi:hypothetical protein
LKVQEYECGKKLVIREAWFGAKIASVKEVCENAELALEVHRPVQFRGTGFGASVAPTDDTSGNSLAGGETHRSQFETARSVVELITFGGLRIQKFVPNVEPTFVMAEAVA